MSSASFVFLDETGATTAMLSRYGWGPKGERLARIIHENNHGDQWLGR